MSRQAEPELERTLPDLAARIEEAVGILEQLIAAVHFQAALHGLTAREVEILDCLAQGRSNAEIARVCWITEDTVKFHLKNLFRKLKIHDRGQAMRLARALQRTLHGPFE